MIAPLLATIALSADQSKVPFYRDRNWSVHRNREACSLVSGFSGGSLFWMSYNFGLNQAVFVISHPSFKSVTNGSSYRLSLYFRKNGKIDDSWGMVDAKGVIIGDRKAIKFMLDGTDAIADVAQSSLIGLMRDDVVVASLSLDGSAAAVERLRVCSKLVHQENPSDPLAGAEIKE